MCNSAGPRYVRFPHRPLRHDQLLRPGRERVEGQTQVQPGGKNAPTLRATAGKETRRLKLCQTSKTHVSTLFRHDVGHRKIQSTKKLNKKVAKKDFLQSCINFK